MSGVAPNLRTAVLISGSGSNLQAIINAVQQGELPIQLVGVLSDRSHAFGLQRAQAAGLTAVTVDRADFPTRSEFDRALGEALDQLEPDLVVLAGFMRILAADVVERYAGRMLNIHPSLLPKYPGLHTYRRVLEAGDSWHGATVHFVTPELDAGPAIIQYRLPVHPGDDENTLRARTQHGEYLIYPKAIGLIASGRLTLGSEGVTLDGTLLAEILLVNES